MTERHMGEGTERPWFVGAQNDQIYIADRAPSPAPYDGPIPDTRERTFIASVYGTHPVAEANARLIVTAVNHYDAHQRCVEALKLAISAYEDPSIWLEDAREALSSLEKNK